MARLGLVLALLALAGCGGTPGAPSEGRRLPPGPWFGFNDNSPVARQTTAPQSAALGEAAGANSVRVTIDWAWVERTRGTLALGEFDEIYRAHRAAGLWPLIVITGSPRWAWPPGSPCPAGRDCPYAPARDHDEAWSRFAAAVAERYPEALAIEVWNEPNERSAWLPRPDPRRYAELLELAHDAIERVAPDLPVLGGSLAPNLRREATAESTPMAAFLQAMYEAGAREHMDGLAIHPYPFSTGLERTEHALELVRGVRDDANDDADLWITEFGLASHGGIDEREQATTLAGGVEQLLAEDDVEAVFVHALVEPTFHPPGSLLRSYGVVRPSLEPKPAYCALGRAVGGRDPCDP